MRTDEEWMSVAMGLASEAELAGEVPVGAVIVGPDGEELGRGRNRKTTDQDPTAHAEMVALRDACARSGCWHLGDATLYVTLEPCAMCAGALVLARVARVVYGCDDPKAGAVRSLFTIGQDSRLNHRFEVASGISGEACSGQLKAFFVALRAQGKK